MVVSSAHLAPTVNIRGFMALLPLIQKDFSISLSQAGLYSTFYFFSATVVSVFIGWVVDVLGVRKSLIAGLVSLGLLMIAHAFVSLYGLILILAFFTGIGFSIITPSANKAVADQVSVERRAFSIGLTLAFSGLGGFIGAIAMPVVAVGFGWRVAVFMGGLIALLGSCLVWCFVPPTVKADLGPTGDGLMRIKTILADFWFQLGVLVRNRYLLVVGLVGLIFGISISGISGHYSLFLSHDLSYNPGYSGLGLGLLQIGGTIGLPVCGLASDRLFGGNRRVGLMAMAFSTAFFCLFFGFFVSKDIFSLPLVMLFSFLLGFIVMGMPGIYFTFVSELVTPFYAGAATGLSLIFIRSGAVISPYLFGNFADYSGSYSLSWIFLGMIVFFLAVLFTGLSAQYVST
jgi:MFS family permease